MSVIGMLRQLSEPVKLAQQSPDEDNQEHGQRHL